MSIWITNAYDSTNLGDGFLLESVIARARIPAELTDEIVIVSNNPGTVGQLSGLAGRPVRSIQAPNAVRSREIKKFAFQGLRNLSGFVPFPAATRPRAIIAMAGGYTSFTGTLSSLGFLNDHFAMIDMPRRFGIPGLMFPVSIGPVGGIGRSRILRAYSHFDTVMLRDDESVRELAGLKNVLRVPDMAVQKIAAEMTAAIDGGVLARAAQARPDESRMTLIGRDLGAPFPNYPAKATELSELTGGLWRLQVPKDEAFYKAQALPYQPGPIDYSATAERSAVVVSVRLHGALMSVLSGVPAVHLSYDRKGAGAYGDLGIAEWLHDANTFDPKLVARQAAELAADPSPFWERLRAHLPAVLAASQAQDARTDAFWGRFISPAAQQA